jgi:hypothetical protein
LELEDTATRLEGVAMDEETKEQDLLVCLPWEVFDKEIAPRLKLRRRTSRAWFIQWLTQQAIAPLLGGAGPALLLLQITNHISERKGYAWISSRTLQAMSGCNEKTLGQHRRVLTAPCRIAGETFPPLFRIELVGRGLRRRVRWWALHNGWRPFLLLLDEATRAVQDEVQTARQREQAA